MFSYTQAKYLYGHRYSFLCACLLIALVCYPLSFGKPLLVALAHVFLVLVLLFITYLIERNSLSYKILTILGSLIILFSFFELRLHSNTFHFIFSAILLAFYTITIFSLLQDITHQKRVTRDIILGALCVYFMIGLLYAAIYVYLVFQNPDSFYFNTAKNQTHLERSYNLIYFSFTTLSTVGFGDIVPKTFMAKGLVVIEEITGLFYLAVLVSRLVTAMKINKK